MIDTRSEIPHEETVIRACSLLYTILNIHVYFVAMKRNYSEASFPRYLLEK